MGKPNSPQEIETKAEELKWFKSAQALCSAFPSGEPNQPDPPAPDIQFSGLGIEITQYYKKGGSPRRRVEDKHDEILANAQHAFESVADVKVLVSVPGPTMKYRYAGYRSAWKTGSSRSSAI